MDFTGKIYDGNNIPHSIRAVLAKLGFVYFDKDLHDEEDIELVFSKRMKIQDVAQY